MAVQRWRCKIDKQPSTPMFTLRSHGVSQTTESKWQTEQENRKMEKQQQKSALTERHGGKTVHVILSFFGDVYCLQKMKWSIWNVLFCIIDCYYYFGIWNLSIGERARANYFLRYCIVNWASCWIPSTHNLPPQYKGSSKGLYVLSRSGHNWVVLWTWRLNGWIFWLSLLYRITSWNDSFIS